MRLPTALLLLAAAALPVRAAPESEIALRAQITQESELAFIDENFARLEEMARDYRTNRTRTPSGLWRLTVFYAGVQGVLDEARRSPPGMREAKMASHERRVRRWVERYPESPSAHIMSGIALIERAWSYRGSGYAHTVPPEAWPPFHEHVAKARAYLEEHKTIAAADPRWYQAMLEVARLQSWEQERFDTLLEEALTREPLYYQTYFEALEHLLPKWHGDVEAIERFAQAAVKRTAAQEGRGMYARIYWYASQVQYDNDLFKKSLAVWPRMREGFDDVVARYPDPWNLNNFAKFACLAGDKAKTRELLARVQPQVVRQAWDPESLLQQCVAWATGEGTPR